MRLIVLCLVYLQSDLLQCTEQDVNNQSLTTIYICLHFNFV